MSWPSGFTLETTENQCRERRRLVPAKYTFDLKFLKEEHRERVKKTNSSLKPLENLLVKF